jgi:hypothetical protein
VPEPVDSDVVEVHVCHFLQVCLLSAWLELWLHADSTVGSSHPVVSFQMKQTATTDSGGY